MYFLVWLLIRLSGRRTLASVTTFDFVLVLIVSEATQQALLGEDYSFTNGALVVMTMVWIDVALGRLRVLFPAIEDVLDGRPILIMRGGEPLHDRMHRECVDREDILHAARHTQGLARLEEVEHAVLEPSGGISVIPKQSAE
jgi:uncharacterized membrane protein YcaP (DUF421 family)